MHISGRIRLILLSRTLLLVTFLTFSFAKIYGQDAKTAALEGQADALMEKDDYTGALKLYTRIIESTKTSEPWLYNILYKRSVCYYTVGDNERALQDINRVVKEFPDSQQVLMLRVFIYRELDEDEAQLKDLEKLIQSDPLNAELLKMQGALLIQTDRYSEALEKLKLSRTLQNDSEVLLHIGLAHYYLNNPDSALLHFDEAIALDAEYLPAYFYAGSVCLEESAFEMAITYIDKGLALDGGNSSLIFYKGAALVEMDQRREGCRYLSKAFYSGIDDAAGYLKEYCY